MNYIVKFAMNSKYVINMISYSKNPAYLILEPVTTAFRLSLLKYKIDGTKIGINNNNITSQENSYFQGLYRWYDKHTELSNLKNPVKKLVTWYDPENKSILYLFESAIHGLRQLKKTYNGEDKASLRDSLDHYVDIIKYKIEKKELNVEKIDERSNLIFEELKTIWSESEIDIIVKLLQNLNEDPHNVHKLKSIECLLDDKDVIVHNIVNQIIINN